MDSEFLLHWAAFGKEERKLERQAQLGYIYIKNTLSRIWRHQRSSPWEGLVTWQSWTQTASGFCAELSGVCPCRKGAPWTQNLSKKNPTTFLSVTFLRFPSLCFSWIYLCVRCSLPVTVQHQAHPFSPTPTASQNCPSRPPGREKNPWRFMLKAFVRRLSEHVSALYEGSYMCPGGPRKWMAMRWWGIRMKDSLACFSNPNTEYMYIRVKCTSAENGYKNLPLLLNLNLSNNLRNQET